MSREVSADFEEYKRHLLRSRYDGLLGDEEYLGALRRAHQDFLSLLTLCSELTEPDGDLTPPFEARFGIQARAYLREVVSDVGQANFCFASGAYKASLVTLRSAIESFAKCFSLQNDPAVLTQKNVYLVFEIAKKSPFFQASPAKEQLGLLLQIYDELNMYVHTVTDAAMFHYMSLGVFPQYDGEKAARIGSFLHRVSNAIVYSVVIDMRSDVFQIHHRNRDLIVQQFSAQQRAEFNKPRA